jgi:hypothetical protein
VDSVGGEKRSPGLRLCSTLSSGASDLDDPGVTLGAATKDDDKASARVRSASATRVKGLATGRRSNLAGDERFMVRDRKKLEIVHVFDPIRELIFST